jgi:predicted O-methyltransferase YrrM
MEELQYVEFPPAWSALKRQSKAAEFGMASEPLLGALLRVLAASRPGGRILELGTGTGMATAWLLDGMAADATLVSVDNDSDVQRIAAQTLGADNRLTLVAEDGTPFLQKQPARSFDLVFADAMPGKYEALEAALAVVKPGGFYVVDDLLPQANWPDGHAAKVPVLLRQLAACEDFSIVPMAWASGIVIAVRKQ